MMLNSRRCWLLLAFWVVSSTILASPSSSDSLVAVPTGDCGDDQQNVEKGMIRLPDSLSEVVDVINCSWTYVAPPDRKLMVKVDSVHLPPSDVRSSSFQLFIDEQLYDIPRNCVKCLRDIVGGNMIKVIFSSHVLQDHQIEQNTTEGVGSFQLRYKSFDPHRCPKPEQVENGQVVSKGRKVGQSVFFRCNPPYNLFGEPEARCIIPTDSPVPEWNSQTPYCVIEDCGNEPIIREASSGSITSPGYPTYMNKLTSPCEWVIKSQMNQQIKISITYLKLPQLADPLNTDNISCLSLIDGDSNYIANLTETFTDNTLNFTTMTNKLTVQLRVSENTDTGIGFYLNYSAVSSTCPKPKTPPNGNVSGYSNDLGSVITFSCSKGFVLVGESRSECMLNGKWSHPAPACEPFILENPSFVAATNKSEIVTTRVVEEFEPSIPLKPMKSGKRKGKDFAVIKSTPKPESKVKPTELSDVLFENEQSKSGESRNGKNRDKDHGPKSEPHLSQIIPAKSNVKKGKIDEEDISTSDNVDKKQKNISETEDTYPDIETNSSEDPETDNFPFMSHVTMVAIIAGVGAPLAVAVIILIAVLIYRRRYPVRMRFGRKFSTFENPMYVSKDAHHPRELKRLTTP